MARSMRSEYGFDTSFEALVAEIAAKFLTSFDASRERCWIADIDGDPGRLGVSGQAQRRCRQIALAAGRSGRRADRASAGGWSANASRFARACGYRKITLWTQSILVAARKIYQDAGFRLVASEPHRSFGQSLIGETWEREL